MHRIFHFDAFILLTAFKCQRFPWRLSIRDVLKIAMMFYLIGIGHGLGIRMFGCSSTDCFILMFNQS